MMTRHPFLRSPSHPFPWPPLQGHLTSLPPPPTFTPYPFLQVNEVADDKAMIRAMQGEIEALKRQLVGGRGGNGRQGHFKCDALRHASPSIPFPHVVAST